LEPKECTAGNRYPATAISKVTGRVDVSSVEAVTE
jgi:hypothetical protein